MSNSLRHLGTAVEIVCLALWTGALFGFAILTAPRLFALIGSRTIAGSVTAAVLGSIDILAFVFSGIILVLGVLRRLWGQSLQGFRVAGVVAMLLLTLYAHLFIVGRMNAVQARMDRPIEQYAVTDPLRSSFDALHQQSRVVYGGVLLLGIGLLAHVPWRQR